LSTMYGQSRESVVDACPDLYKNPHQSSNINMFDVAFISQYVLFPLNYFSLTDVLMAAACSFLFLFSFCAQRRRWHNF